MRRARKIESIELSSSPSTDEGMILKIVTIEELRTLLNVYQRVKGNPILIGVRDLKRLIVGAVATQADADGLVRKLGGDGWLVLSPYGAKQTMPSGIKVSGEIRKKAVRARFDGTRLRSNPLPSGQWRESATAGTGDP